MNSLWTLAWVLICTVFAFSQLQLLRQARVIKKLRESNSNLRTALYAKNCEVVDQHLNCPDDTQ